MTEKVRIVNRIECSETTFWELFRSQDYNQNIFLKRMNFPRWEITRLEEKGDRVERTVEVEPYIGELPPAVKKVIGERICYREEGSLNIPEKCYELRVISNVLPSKILVSGSQRTEKVDEHTVNRIFEMEVQVKIFGVGGLIEKSIVADLKKGYNLGAVYTNEYIREQGLR
ncbi:MAG: DUF2505 domain-containing protein [Polyangiaceae bacterium]|nr:DUF2505 domain-containing protein [Polyangiaceae bacterium]